MTPTYTPIASSSANHTRVLKAVAGSVEAATIKELAASLTGPLRTEMEKRANGTIKAIIDDLCGTPSPPLVRRPWPGPSPQALDLATVLTLYANTAVRTDSLRKVLIDIAGRAVKKAYETDGLQE